MARQFYEISRDEKCIGLYKTNRGLVKRLNLIFKSKLFLYSVILWDGSPNSPHSGIKDIINAEEYMAREEGK
jgi:hypothetical protein